TPKLASTGPASAKEIEVSERDVRVEVMRAQGAGGQHVNKTESAVRLTHVPTGIVVSCQRDRSQIKNKATAMEMLRSRLYQMEQAKKAQERADNHALLPEHSWGSQIRTYVMMPYQLVKDLRSGHERGDVQNVLDGDIGRCGRREKRSRGPLCVAHIGKTSGCNAEDDILDLIDVVAFRPNDSILRTAVKIAVAENMRAATCAEKVLASKTKEW
ncbi:hypothetical protein HK405_002875, partial [Cladochytrium tenue]